MDHFVYEWSAPPQKRPLTATNGLWTRNVLVHIHHRHVKSWWQASVSWVNKSNKSWSIQGINTLLLMLLTNASTTPSYEAIIHVFREAYENAITIQRCVQRNIHIIIGALQVRSYISAEMHLNILRIIRGAYECTVSLLVEVLITHMLIIEGFHECNWASLWKCLWMNFSLSQMLM